MSSGNGHLPEGAEIATLAMLREANQAWTPMPELTQKRGRPMFARIRTIRRQLYSSWLPELPAESASWPAEGRPREEAYQAWFTALPANERRDRLIALQKVTTLVLAEGVIEPATTLDQAGDWGEDAETVARAILVLSGLVPTPSVPAETKAETTAAA
jgi:hypothetical protein